MGLYSDVIIPVFFDKSMDKPLIQEARKKTLENVSGKILEIGFVLNAKINGRSGCRFVPDLLANDFHGTTGRKPVRHCFRISHSDRNIRRRKYLSCAFRIRDSRRVAASRRGGATLRFAVEPNENQAFPGSPAVGICVTSGEPLDTPITRRRSWLTQEGRESLVP